MKAIVYLTILFISYVLVIWLAALWAIFPLTVGELRLKQAIGIVILFQLFAYRVEEGETLDNTFFEKILVLGICFVLLLLCKISPLP